MPRTDLRVAVTLDGDTFRRFAWFHTLRRQGKWIRPLLFAAIMAGLAALCFSRANGENWGALLGWILLAVGAVMPVVWFGGFARSVQKQIKGMGLPRPVYNIEFDETGVTCYHTAGGGEAEITPWDEVNSAWRRRGAIYLYVQPGKAYLLPAAGDPRRAERIWARLGERLPKKKLHG